LNIEQVWRKLGRQPHYSDMRKPLSKYCGGAYEYRWGSWRKALEAFIAFINEEDKYISNIKQKMVENSNDHAITDIDKKEPCCKKVTRTISVRLRFIVMKRDSFKCRLCGASPALKPGLVLHVDHIKPLSKGGDTVLENLQTLCDKCNIGKSDLPLDF
jgi:predicted restriction endonuclease